MRTYNYLSFCLIMMIYINLHAQEEMKATGMGFRISYYDAGPHSAKFKRIGYLNMSSEANGGAGIMFFIFSRFSDRFLVEFSVGGLAQFTADQRWYMDEEVNVFSAVPLLTGIRMEIFPVTIPGIIKPYVSAGPGAYIVSDIHVERKNGVERGTVESRLAAGGYAAAGLNLHFTPSFALNFEAKYHLVDFDVNHDRSGAEIGLGLVFLWGNYVPTSNNVLLNIKD